MEKVYELKGCSLEVQAVIAGFSRRCSSGGGIGREGPVALNGMLPLLCEVEPLEFVRAMEVEGADRLEMDLEICIASCRSCKRLERDRAE